MSGVSVYVCGVSVYVCVLGVIVGRVSMMWCVSVVNATMYVCMCVGCDCWVC